MLPILPSRRGPSAGEVLGNVAREFAGMGAEYLAGKNQQQAMERENAALKQMGIDAAGLGPDMRKLVVAEALKGNRKQQEISSLRSLRTPQQAQRPTTEEKIPWYMQEFAEPNNGPSEQQMIEDPALIPDEAIEEAAIINPAVAREWRAAKDSALRQKQEEAKARSKKETEYFKFNEPKLAEIAQNERKVNLENARFSRMEELFTDPSKFPSPLLASIFSKDGTINDIAYSQLTPEAQEVVKLIVDSTSGIKDTYGSRVTNFDLQTYLRKLPSLLTSPEGRNRILRDLKAINDINQIYNEGIQDIFDEAGGSDKISFSEAEKRFKKKYGQEVQRRIDKFVTPEKGIFKDLPNPKTFLGKKIKDKDTGEILISDGKEWKPYTE